MLAFETMIRLSASIGVLSIMLILQHAFPRRAQRLAWRRWPSNFGLVVISSLLVRLLIPTAAIGVALYAEAQGLGLLRWLGVNEFLGGILAVL
ncbi:MAG: sterol desaturase family protein, partial [Alphaproteobacteria bacterium]